MLGVDEVAVLNELKKWKMNASFVDITLIDWDKVGVEKYLL